MNNIFDVWEFVRQVTNTYMNGYVTPDEVSKALDVGQEQTFNLYLSQRQRGSELALNALRPFVNQSTITASSTGLLTYPALWAETRSIYTTIDGNLQSVKVVLNQELQQAVNSAIYPIAEYPRYLEQTTGVQLYPKAALTVDWEYIKRPISPVIGYTFSGTEVVYDPATSVQLEFDNQYWPEIILKALIYIGVNLSDEQVTQLGLNLGNGSTN